MNYDSSIQTEQNHTIGYIKFTSGYRYLFAKLPSKKALGLSIQMLLITFSETPNSLSFGST